jgi:hypothetical protein
MDNCGDFGGEKEQCLDEDNGVNEGNCYYLLYIYTIFFLFIFNYNEGCVFVGGFCYSPLSKCEDFDEDACIDEDSLEDLELGIISFYLFLIIMKIVLLLVVFVIRLILSVRILIQMHVKILVDKQAWD